MNYDLIADVIGWMGAFLLLTAYALVSFKKLTGDSLIYQLMNVVAGIFLAIITYYRGAYPAAFLNTVWTIIALVVIATMMRKHAKSSN
jgi:hypothetical protein